MIQLGLAGAALAGSARPGEAAPPEGATGPIWAFSQSVYFAGNRTVRLRRLHSLATGDIFYTTSAAELVPAGYTDESDEHPAWVYSVTDPALAPPDSDQLLRLWNPRLRAHFSTTSESLARTAQRERYELQAEYPAPYVPRSAPDSPHAVTVPLPPLRRRR
ncbi:hypothetical protein Kisp02_32610 [Kineosporia sp. NBRC 101731]|nr:hypothetical protein Kisp02_32610 [Kineosporia sp. NBRC 101731]